ncbi:hypothetical protein KV557_35135 [Kitasatospora aureofaciens]|uniref:hypothetical protein n=1 Tax=Kitasatospora aureofaciens TaxID=1894 RepID=UPI001C477FB9|nr:hypothetical protein [Kitasatospora aureofaciens]MBV6702280.1 hypothetical protein [Kitasatospora aureofaciens]
MNPDPALTKTARTLDIREGLVTGLAMGGLALLFVFLSVELSNSSPPDLSKLGLSGIVSLVIAVLANPQGKAQKRCWWVLLVATGTGAIASAALTGFAGHPAAAPTLSVFAAAFLGLLVDGEKWSVGSPKGAGEPSKSVDGGTPHT